MSCDIIIPVWGQFNFTKQCLESVFKNTSFAFHLIIIDNASSEPTRGYLVKLAEDRKGAVTLLKNESNLGFIKAVNQGIEISSTPYICLLNNDTEVTEGWLAEMVKVAESNEDIGIVNPNSNTMGTKPRAGQSKDALAKELKSHTGEYSELAWATGFCMLIKRRLIEEIGLFDEIYGMGNFEDADFSKRAQELGYRSACAQAAYVYHRERRSFKKHKRFDQNFEKNRQIFYARWGKQQRILYVLTKDNPASTEKLAQAALKLAREGNIIWFFLKARDREGIGKHSNIYVYNLPKMLFNLVGLWRILKRKKKFDKIYVDDEGYAKRLDNLKFFHKAEVIYGA